MKNVRIMIVLLLRNHFWIFFNKNKTTINLILIFEYNNQDFNIIIYFGEIFFIEI